MIALAILLLVAAAAIVIWVIMGLNGNNANTIHFDAPGINTDIKPLTLFLLGALALLLIWAATRLIAAGTKRKYRKHKETRELKREHKEHEKLQQREQKAHDRERVEADRHQDARHDHDLHRDDVHRDDRRDVRTVEADQREFVGNERRDVVADGRTHDQAVLDSDQVRDTGRHYN